MINNMDMRTNIALLIEQAVNVVDTDTLNTSIRLTDEEQLFLCKHFERVELDKNDYLIRKGEVENYIYFIESGIFRYWVSGMDSDTEVTCGFSFSCEFANAYSSLNNKELSVFNVQALCKSVIWRLSKRNLSYLYKTSLNINKIMRVTLEYAFARKTVRELSLLRYTPEERYVKLLEGDKMLLQNIPLKYIASYIGITPQALSCIRKRIT